MMREAVTVHRARERARGRIRDDQLARVGTNVEAEAKCHLPNGGDIALFRSQLADIALPLTADEPPLKSRTIFRLSIS